MNWKSLFLVLALLIIGLPILLCAGYLLWFMNALSIPSSFDTDQTDYFRLTDTFARSLAFNRTENIRSYTDSSMWNFILRWEAEHVPVADDPNECHYPDLDLGPSMGGGTTGDGEFLGGYLTQMTCNGEHYFLRIEDIHLQVVDGKWTILDWKMICENDEDKCWE